ncbi:ABC transporter permease [Youngiibacter multivorans]|uniref:Simple sugar transport system permease protein n=1 Tax=Youngiibacter multivorans TaxID=937251 RepID=A0ABS4G0Z2_9CLOT|nr:ABC transporter permease [Youngiibacter multivorans]MBP1918218.1 simple sugar transport system permease protein [Youngiibacter multivorans]
MSEATKKRATIKALSALGDFGNSLLSVAIAVIIGGLIILAIGENPIEAYTALIEGSLGNARSIANTFSKSIPLAFTGLAVAMANRGGMLNIGAEGQLHAGAMATALVALALPGLPVVILLPVCIISGVAAGMLVGFIPGYFKAKKQTSEVIVAIMLNYIVTLFMSFLVNGPFKAEGSVSQTNAISEGLMLNKLIENSQLTTALFILLAVAAVQYIFLWKSAPGFQLRAVGSNPSASVSAGMNSKKLMIFSMSLSGGIAALAGVTEVLGKYGRYIEGFSPSFGFTGIAVAILGRNHPGGVLVTSLLFGILDTGALRMGRVTNVSANIIIVIQSLVILLVSAPEIAKMIRRRG